MRIFHLSDLHIGLKLINRDLREDQEYILDQIIQKAAEKVPDAIVIAGTSMTKQFRLQKQWRCLIILSESCEMQFRIL